MASDLKFGKETTSEQVVDSFAAQILGKTVLITGVSPNGLGEALTRAIASKRPSQLIVTARSIDKAAIVVEQLKADFPFVAVKIIQLDLASFESVRQAVAEVQDSTESVDILINNAGVMGLPELSLSEDGIEMHLATNYLGHFLFTNLIMNKFLASAARNKLDGSTRIINITSGGYVLSPFRFSDYNFNGKPIPKNEEPNAELAAMMGIPNLDAQGGYMPMMAYCQSNTACMLFTTQLAEKLKDNGVLSFSAAPGVVETELQRHLPKGFKNPHMFYKTPSQGAATFLVAAFDPSLEDQTGAFLDDCHVVSAGLHATDRGLAARLWELSENLTKEKFLYN